MIEAEVPVPTSTTPGPIRISLDEPHPAILIAGGIAMGGSLYAVGGVRLASSIGLLYLLTGIVAHIRLQQIRKRGGTSF